MNSAGRSGAVRSLTAVRALDTLRTGVASTQEPLCVGARCLRIDLQSAARRPLPSSPAYAGQATPASHDAADVGEETLESAFRSPSPEDTDVVRVGSPRDGEAESRQPDTAQAPTAGTTEVPLTACGTAAGSAAGQTQEGADGEELPGSHAPAGVTPTRAAFAGFTADEGAALTWFVCALTPCRDSDAATVHRPCPTSSGCCSFQKGRVRVHWSVFFGSVDGACICRRVVRDAGRDAGLPHARGRRLHWWQASCVPR